MIAANEKQEKKSYVLNMTQGRSLRLILIFMAPVLLGQLVQQTYNMVDAMIVGRLLGADALASVGASSSMQFMIIGFVSGCCDGFSISAAQRFGADDEAGLKRCVFHSALLAAIFAAVICAAGAVFAPQIIDVLRTPDNIRMDAIRYLRILFLGIPFTFFYNIQASLLRAVGNSKMPFIFLAVSAGMNVFLDLFCVAVLHWGVSGAAIATITSQLLSGLFCLSYIVRKAPILHPAEEERHLNLQTSLNLISMGVPMGLQFSITAIGSMVMQAANNSLGSMYVSGYTAADRVEQFVMCPYVALSSSVATYVGQNYGAMKLDRVKKGVTTSIIMGHIYGLVFGCLMAVLGGYAAALFLPAGSEEIVAVSGKFLKIIGFTFWLVSAVNVYRPAMQGLGKPLLAIFSGVIEMFARAVFAMVMIRPLKFTAICWTNQAAWITAGAYVILMYYALIRRMEHADGIKTE